MKSPVVEDDQRSLSLSTEDTGDNDEDTESATSTQQDTAPPDTDTDTDTDTDSVDTEQPDTSPPGDTGSLPSCDCPEGYESTPADDACQQVSEVSPTYSGASRNTCAIAPYFAYGKYGARYPGGEQVQSSFWGMDDGSSLGRLNEIGVWTCESPGSTTSGSEPLDDWIGFSICLEMDEPGDYLTGMGADNRMRLLVDGQLAFEEDTGSTAAFNYWWVQAVSLTSGLHILEFDGKNDSDLAGLGAELAGPFEYDSLDSDDAMIAADYEGSLLWSTADAEGFERSTTRGSSCPDGYALSLCDADPVCLQIDTTSCL